jgi:hypothetical protein
MSQPSQELHNLIESLLNDDISTAEHARLQELLLSDRNLQEQYFRHLDLHLALKSVVAEPDETDSAVEMVARFRQKSSWMGNLENRRRSILLAAILVMAGLSYFAVPQHEPRLPPGTAEAVPSVPASEVDAPPEVVLAQAAGAELFDEMLPALNHGMQYQHEYVLLNGLVQLLFPHGATTVIESPAVFVIESPAQLSLRVGRCSVHAPDGAEGFQVTTPKTRIVDLGTRFSVSVDEIGQSEVQVVEGAAEMHATTLPDSSMETLISGQARRYEGDVEGPRNIPFESQRYLRHLPDRLVSYEAAPAGAGPAVKDLLSVTVQRGGIERKYLADELIGLDIVGFRSESNPNNLCWDEAPPADPTIALAGDRALNTGVINFDSADQPSTEPNGLSVRFHRPIVNGPGPDVVFFEIQSVIYPVEGDHFLVHPLAPEEGLHPYLVRRFDITLKSKNALQVAPFRVFVFESPSRTLQELCRFQQQQRSLALSFSALAVGIDLSFLGYAEGAAVEGLRFEDAGDDEDIVDPVFIAGLPWEAPAQAAMTATQTIP